METPSSMRRVTRSKTSALSQKTKQEETSSMSRNSVNNERLALLDITNDSPVNGLATEKTPLPSVMKNGGLSKTTPGSGEALLRGQVKILLEKVEEDAEFVNKLSTRNRAPFLLELGILPLSPALLAAPTPANTPQVFNNSEPTKEAADVFSAFIKDIPMPLPQVVETLKPEESLDSQECAINRALLFDSPGKSETADISSNISSSLTYQGSKASRRSAISTDDDNSSIWSIQANASGCSDDEEEIKDSEEEENDSSEEPEEAEECLDGFVDDLCEGLKKITVEENGDLRLPQFAGKHTRFLYNSEGEYEGEKEISVVGHARSPNVMLLKGLPVPEGKHLRFHDEDEA
ncbi:hypothetical protein HPP92_027059 [Vanilla planifolia]|uniref:Chalcone-flavanone isomerase family protein n=1 Tax=Vanilla planifolia TaxID=51239 RepID=A0A835U665_VANPL|nr:hypothetical protein HPP92_027059 [Vanilla planifolia]